MQSGTYFHLVDGPAPYIAIMDVVETETLLGSPNEYIIAPCQAFWGISFEELARAKRGMLIMPSPGVGVIVANDDWPTDPEETP